MHSTCWLISVARNAAHTHTHTCHTHTPAHTYTSTIVFALTLRQVKLLNPSKWSVIAELLMNSPMCTQHCCTARLTRAVLAMNYEYTLTPSPTQSWFLHFAFGICWCHSCVSNAVVITTDCSAVVVVVVFFWVVNMLSLELWIVNCELRILTLPTRLTWLSLSCTRLLAPLPRALPLASLYVYGYGYGYGYGYVLHVYFGLALAICRQLAVGSWLSLGACSFVHLQC